MNENIEPLGPRPPFRERAHRRRHNPAQDVPPDESDFAGTEVIVPADSNDPPPPGASSIDAGTILELLARRWHWFILSGLALSIVGFMVGFVVWKKEYTAVAQLVRYESPNTADVFGYRQISAQTFSGMLKSRELLDRISARTTPRLSTDAIAERLRVMPEHNTEIVAIGMAGRTAEDAVNLANLYGVEAVRYTQEMQAKSAAEVSQYLRQQLREIDQDISRQHQRYWVPPRVQTVTTATTTNQIIVAPPPAPAPFLAGRLDAANQELLDLLVRFTDAHPLVEAQRAKIHAIEQQLAQAEAKAARLSVPAPAPTTGTPAATTGTAAAAGAAPAAGADQVQPAPAPISPSYVSMDPEVLRSKFQSLENARVVLEGRLRASEAFERAPPGYFRVLASATPKDVVVHGRRLKVAFLGVFCGVIGVLLAAAAAMLAELTDDRLKTTGDLKRVTRLPVLATLNNLGHMTANERRQWAFHTWTTLQSYMTNSPNHGLVCGVTSSQTGEGRTTWVNLLAEAASQSGFRVLTIATRPSPGHEEISDSPFEDPAEPRTNGDLQPKPDETGLLTTNVLASPADVTEKLVGPNSQPMVHIPLPGWVWNLDRRKQWQAALNQWRQIDNIVILVELPPASVPESVLLAENIPNLIWLAESGKALARDSRSHLHLLRHARCNLVGAVLNHRPFSPLNDLFPRWIDSTS